MNYKFFTERIGMVGYFWSLLFGTLTSFLLLGVVASNTAAIIVVIFFILMLFIVLSIKRLHDVNLSGFYVFIPLCFIILVAITPVIGGFAAFPALILSTIFLTLKKGTVGPNKYGEDPVYRKVPVTPSEK